MDDRQTINANVTAVISAPREISVNQARWVLLRLFGYWVLFSVAGVIIG